jgi:hypothetical protein
MNIKTPTRHEILMTKRNEELADLFNAAAESEAWDDANEIWNALYARVYRLDTHNSMWFVGDAREMRYIRIVNQIIDSAR